VGFLSRTPQNDTFWCVAKRSRERQTVVQISPNAMTATSTCKKNYTVDACDLTSTVGAVDARTSGTPSLFCANESVTGSIRRHPKRSEHRALLTTVFRLDVTRPTKLARRSGGFLWHCTPSALAARTVRTQNLGTSLMSCQHTQVERECRSATRVR